MPRTNQQSTAPSLTDPAEAAVAEGTGQGSPSKKKASAKKTASRKKAAARNTTPRPARYGRAEALVDALKKGGTRDEITRYSDKLYVKHGNGTSSLKGARAQFDLTLGTLKAAGVVTEDAEKRLTFNG